MKKSKDNRDDDEAEGNGVVKRFKFSENLGVRYGIVQRVNSQMIRMKGLVKQTAGDFIVNEIDLDGNVVRLTNFDIPVVEVPEVIADLEDSNQKRIKAEERIREIIDDEKTYKDLIEALERNDKNDNIRVKAPLEKGARKELHDFIKIFYKQFNSNTTTDPEGMQIIEINHKHSSRRNARDAYESQANSKQEFKFCEAVMYKDSIDTLQAVSLISKGLKINQKRIGYAGTKDKRAKTTQRLSFFCIGMKQIVGLNKNFHNVKLGNFRLYNGEGLKLGDLSGNRFTITIRCLKSACSDHILNEEQITNAVNGLKENGFVNYFGLQRFGSCLEAPTHSIGKMLIQGRIKEAVELILHPRPVGKEREEVQFARHIWNTDNTKAEKAFALIERINCVEKFLLEGLSRCKPNDYLGAFHYVLNEF